MEFTKHDLIPLSKKLGDAMQEITDYDCFDNEDIQQDFDNAIAGISDAQGSIDRVINLIK